MSKFLMCKSCSEEYKNVENRRFHAEPNCCVKCGPRYDFIDLNKNIVDYETPIQAAKGKIKLGKIVAIKGLGGFHLCCDALNEKAINLLRERKRRHHKPLAIMAKDIKSIGKMARISSIEENILTGKRRPIVILEKSPCYNLPQVIAPKQNSIGIMLPYTPLHYLLFDDNLSYLVMTSGNINGQPLQYKNEQGIEALRQITDFLLIHNRDIHIPVDDSVVKVVLDKEMVSRPGRGYSPFSLKLSNDKKEILGVGADQKSTFCILKNGYATMSQYLGDLNDDNNCKRYEENINHILKIYEAKPRTTIHDLHPTFISTRFAKNRSGRHIGVQHHHAHMASCMAEHKLFEKVIGVIFDGTGFGTDNAIWGGEFFIGDRRKYKRIAHLQYISLQGGDLSVKEPWRCAVSYLNSLGIDPAKYLKGVDKDNITILQQALSKEFNCFKSSSMGRFFDCISALTGLCIKSTYDGQGAIMLENTIDKSVKEAYPYIISTCNESWEISYEEVIRNVVKDLDKGTEAPKIAAKFHNTIVDMTASMVCIINKKEKLKDVVLSGGVFENRYLLTGIYKSLKKLGFNAYFNELVPINDNGISIGQVAIGEQIIGEE